MSTHKGCLPRPKGGPRRSSQGRTSTVDVLIKLGQVPGTRHPIKYWGGGLLPTVQDLKLWGSRVGAGVELKYSPGCHFGVKDTK